MWVLSCRASVLDHNFKLIEVCTTPEKVHSKHIWGKYKYIVSNQKHGKVVDEHFVGSVKLSTEKYLLPIISLIDTVRSVKGSGGFSQCEGSPEGCVCVWKRVWTRNVASRDYDCSSRTGDWSQLYVCLGDHLNQNEMKLREDFERFVFGCMARRKH